MPIDWDDAVSSDLAPLGANPPGPKDSSRVGGPTDWDTQISRDLSPMANSGPTLAPMRGSSASSWNGTSNFLDALLLGYGKNLMATGPGASEAQSGVLSDYSTRLKKLTKAQETYRSAEPGNSLATEIVGGTATSLGAMALGQDYLAAPAIARLSAAAPRLAPALDFLSGSAGAYGKGLGQALVRSGSLASRGAVEGGVGSALQSNLGTDSLSDQTATGALTGAVLNPLVGPIASRLASHIPANVAEAAQSAIRQKVPLRAGELPGVSPIVSSLDKIFSKSKNAPEREAFYNAVTTQAGLPSKTIDQDWVQRADALNGGTMGRVAGAYSLNGLDPNLNSDLAHLDATAHGNLPSDAYKKFSDLKAKLDNELNTGSVPGAVYQNWTQKGGLISNFAKDPQLRPFVTGPGGIREVLDNAWERSIQGSRSPTAAQDFNAWTAARRQYKNTRIVDEDVNEAGDYNPQKLLSRIQSRYGSAKRAGDLGNLGVAGQFIYKPEKPAAQSHSLLSRVGETGTAGITAAAALGLGEHYGGPLLHAFANDPLTTSGTGMLAAGAAGLGYGAVKGANSILSSPLYTRHLLDVAQGNAKPGLRGLNPLIQGASDVINPRQ